MNSMEIVYCRECDTPCRVPFTIVDELGGIFYCGDCRTPENVPKNHPQHPETTIHG